MRQETKNRDNSKDKNETRSLKYLAYKVLQRNKVQDKNEIKAENKRDKTPPNSAPLSQAISAMPATSEKVSLFEETVLMTRHNGKAQTCIYCGFWEKQKESPWWTGACAITGKGKTNKSHCDVPSYEEVLQ